MQMIEYSDFNGVEDLIQQTVYRDSGFQRLSVFEMMNQTAAQMWPSL